MPLTKNLGALSKPGLLAFLAICEHWHLDDRSSAILLGVSIRSFVRWRRSPPSTLGYNTLERISHTIAIFHALADTFPSKDARNEWVHIPNTADPFGGATALTIMSAPSTKGLKKVRSYLESQLGCFPSAEWPAGDTC